MRTTLTLDPDVVRLIEDAVHRERSSTKVVVNEALRRALGPAGSADTGPFAVNPHDSAIRPGYDLAGFNRLADDIEDDSKYRTVPEAS